MSKGRPTYVESLMDKVEEQTGLNLRKQEVEMAIKHGECYSVDDLLDMLKQSS